jgi:hypothetical protein
MTLDDFFKFQMNDVSSNINIRSKSFSQFEALIFKEIYMSELNINFAIPINLSYEYLSYDYLDKTYLSFDSEHKFISEHNDTVYQITFETNNNSVKEIFINKYYDIKPGYSSISITLKKENDLIIPNAKISFFKNCVQLFATIDKDGKIENINSAYSELTAAYCDKFNNSNVKNSYEGILVDHYKEKQKEKLGDIGYGVGYSNIDLNKTASLFVLATEAGFKKNYLLDYEKTIKNLINNSGNNWEQLLVYMS